MRPPKRKRSDSADAFIPESAQVSGTTDDLAELLAEQFLRSAGGDEVEEETRDEVLAEEMGGPFLESRAEDEFGLDGGDDEAPGPLGNVDPDSPDPLRSALPEAVGPLAIAGLDEEIDEGEEEDDALDAERGSSEVRRLGPDVEPASRVEPAVIVTPVRVASTP